MAPLPISIADLESSLSGEPRIRDLRLAEALGFEAPYGIRKLISRHIEALVRFGEVFSTVDKTPHPTGSEGIGRATDPVLADIVRRPGRPGRTYWLNRRQALYICAKSEAALAAEVTLQMVEVFDAHLEQRRLPANPEPPLLPTPGELRLYLRMLAEYRQALGPAAAAWLIRRLPLPCPPAEVLAHEGVHTVDSLEGEACLRHLAAFDLGGVTVGTAIARVAADRIGEAFLARRLAQLGAAIAPAGGRGCLAVANGGEDLQLDQAFAGSPWAGRRWRQALRTLPGARAAAGTIPFTDSRNGLRATLIPLDVALQILAPPAGDLSPQAG